MEYENLWILERVDFKSKNILISKNDIITTNVYTDHVNI
jgi:hypothetical protein